MSLLELEKELYFEATSVASLVPRTVLYEPFWYEFEFRNN